MNNIKQMTNSNTEMENRPEHMQHPSREFTCARAIQYFNDELNYSEKEQAFGQLMIHNAVLRQSVALNRFFYIVNSLHCEELKKLTDALSFWAKTGIPMLIDISDAKDLSKKLREHADSLFKACAESYVNCHNEKGQLPGLEQRAKYLNIAANETADVVGHIKKAFGGE